MARDGVYDEKFKDMDQTIVAITEEFRWEYHPFIEVVRQQSTAHKPEIAVLYMPPTVPHQMWLFPNGELMPIDTIDDRLARGGGQVHMFDKSVPGIAELCSAGWRITERSLRKEN